jgi:enamine deaminase RidA (YjgF/YER057c/UK114 family)
MTPEAALERLEHGLPSVNTPVGSYVMCVPTDALLFVSGHGAFEDGRPVHTGRLGADLSTEQGANAARAVMLNLLATVKSELGGLTRVKRCVKVVVFVNSAPEFVEQHVVADAATDVLTSIFGNEVGRPARTAIGVAALPLGFAVEIEAVMEVEAR